MGPDKGKFQKKKKKKLNQSFFEGEKSAEMGKVFRHWAAHPIHPINVYIFCKKEKHINILLYWLSS